MELIVKEFEFLLDSRDRTYIGVKELYRIVQDITGVRFNQIKRICEYEFKYVKGFIEDWEEGEEYEGVWLKNFGRFITNHYKTVKDENKETDRDSGGE